MKDLLFEVAEHNFLKPCFNNLFFLKPFGRQKWQHTRQQHKLSILCTVAMAT